jgi:hypothetical protein
MTKPQIRIALESILDNLIQSPTEASTESLMNYSQTSVFGGIWKNEEVFLNPPPSIFFFQVTKFN